MNKPESSITRAFPRIILASIAGIAGWAAGMILLILIDVISRIFSGSGDSSPIDVLNFDITFGIILATFVFFVWLFVLIPIALIVSPQSPFWRPAIPTLLGIGSGPIIIFLYHCFEVRGAVITDEPASIQLGDFLAGAVIYAVPAAIVGGVIGFVAAILNKRFMPRED